MPDTKSATRGRLTIERHFDAPLQDVWDLWTTKEGIEAWWGPDGFSVNVQQLDLRPGGSLVYAMTAAAPEMAEFMKQNGMPVTTVSRLTFTEVVPPKRLAYMLMADFIPGVAAYDVGTVINFADSPQGVHLTLTFDAMHDAEWTERAVMGRNSELDRLARLLASRRAA